MRFFWPTKLNPEPSALVRFGRVLHWIGTGLFVLVVALAIGIAVFAIHLFNEAGGYYYLNRQYLMNGFSFAALVLAFGALLYLAGRALRYIFSGE